MMNNNPTLPEGPYYVGRVCRIAMATITAFSLVSCAKNRDIFPDGIPLAPTVAVAKEAFGQYLQTLPKSRGVDFARRARQGSQRTVHWEQAETVETGAVAGMRIPVSYPSQRTAIIDNAGKAAVPMEIS